LIGLALYGRTIFFDFTYLDDNALIIDNYSYISDISKVNELFSSDVFFSVDKHYYRPILNLSLMIDTFSFGPSLVAYHITNIILHILVASLVFLFFTKLGRSRGLAFFLALMFLVHPLMTQAVAWIPGRNDLLLGALVLAAWLMFLNFIERPRLGTFFGHLFFFWLAVLTKETAIFLPVLTGFYLIFIQPERLNRHDRWLLVTGSGLVIFFWFLMRGLALGFRGDGLVESMMSLVGNLPAVLIYIGKLILPVNLSVFPILADANLFYGAFALLLIAAALIFSRHRRLKYIIFGSLWYAIFLLPSFIRLSGLPDFLEHRSYLPFVGFLIVIAETDWISGSIKQKKLRLSLAYIILVVLFLLSFNHSGVFQDRLTFWKSAVSTSPHSPLAHRNLGAMYYFEKRLTDALKSYETAIYLNSEEPMVRNNIGVIYLDQKKYSEAESMFKQELNINPAYDKALFNLGETYYFQGRDKEAVKLWEATLSVNPGHKEALQRLLK